MDPEYLPKFVYLHKNHKYRLKLGFYAAPSNPKTFSKAVRGELDKLKFTYCPDLNGLVMGFGKISSNELIPADVRHCISVAVNVDVYIFRPPIGSLIEAVVNQTSDNHVSCLVHNLFNVSIVRPEHQPYTQWPGSKIKKDDIINVKVLSFDLTKKLPHITGEIVDKKDECDNSNDQHKINCAKYSSSLEESTHNLMKSIKESTNDSESSDEMDFVRETCSAKCFDEPAKISQVTETHFLNNSIHTKSPLSSSTPVTNSQNSVSGINLIKTKQLKQFYKHLAKNVADKQKSADFVKLHESVKSDSCSLSLDIYENSDHNVNNCKLPGFSMNNTDCSDNANISCGTISSSSGISNDDFVQLKSLSQNSLSSKSKTSLSSTKKHKSPNKIKFQASLDNYVFFATNTNHSGTKYEDNSVPTLHNPDHEKSTESVDKTVSLGIDALNKSKNLSTSKTNLLKLSTSTRNIKQNNFSSNVNFKTCKNENDLVKCQSDAMFTMLSDADSCNNEHDEFSIPCTNQNVDFNKEIENSTICNLRAEKKKFSIDHCTSSSDDEVYTKLKLNMSKMESTMSSIEKTKCQNLYNLFSSDNESNKSDTDTSIVSSLEEIKSNTLPNKCDNMLAFNNCNLNNDNNVLPNKESKKKNVNSVLHKSSEYNNIKSKLLPNFSNNESNKSSNLMKQILEDSSSIDKELTSLKNNSTSLATKEKFKKHFRLESAMKNNSPINLSESTKNFKNLDEKSKVKICEETKNVFLENFNKEKKRFEKIRKKTKSQKSSLVKSNELFNFINTKNAKPEKDLIIENVLKNNDLTQSSILSDASRKKKKKKSALQNTSLATITKNSTNATNQKMIGLILDNIDKINNHPSLLDTTTVKKNKKSEPEKLSMTTTDKSINATSKKMIGLIMKSVEKLNNHPSLLDITTVKQNKKSESEKLSMTTTDKSCNNNIKKKSKKTNNLLLDNSLSCIDDFSSSNNSNYPTQLNKLTKTLEKKIKKTKSPKTSRVQTETVNITNKLACEKKDNLFLDNIVKKLEDSSTMKHKKKSREFEDGVVDFISTPSKKKKVHHYLTTDNLKDELQIKSTVKSLPKISKKNRKELQCDTSNYLTVKDYKTKYDPHIEPKETHDFTDKKNEKKKIKKSKMLPSDYTLHDIQSTSREKIKKTNAGLANSELTTKKINKVQKSKKLEKQDQLSKKKNQVSKIELAEFLSQQNNPTINNLDSLYSSLRF